MKLNKILKNKKRAFTLAEVVIVMGILGVMMAAFAPVVTKKTLAVGANSFRNFGPANGHIGISYGTVADAKTVLIGNTEISNEALYTPKLLITNNINDTNSVSPQIGFATFSESGLRHYHGQLLLDNNFNIFLGDGNGTNSNISTTNKTGVTGIGSFNHCAGLNNTDAQNLVGTVCLGYMSGPTDNDLKQGIYIGGRAIAYGNDRIFFGRDSLSDLIQSYSQQASDIRLKNVGKEFTAGLDEINQLEFYNYTYKRDADKDPKVGIMAQDLQKVFPNAVKENKDGYLYIRKDDMFYAALNAIKELSKMFTTNDEKIKALEERNAMLEQQNQELQNLYIELSKRVEKLDKKKTKGKLTITPEKEVEEEVIDPEFTLKSESTENSEE